MIIIIYVLVNFTLILPFYTTEPMSLTTTKQLLPHELEDIFERSANNTHFDATFR